MGVTVCGPLSFVRVTVCVPEEAAVDDGYPAIYYQTIRDTGIDPVVCGDIPISIGAEGCTESGSAERVARPVPLAAKAIAKASSAPRKKRTPRKAAEGAKTNAAPAGAATVTEATKRANGRARVPAQTPAKTARVASSG